MQKRQAVLLGSYQVANVPWPSVRLSSGHSFSLALKFAIMDSSEYFSAFHQSLISC
jgi:hypothetical protein